MVWADLLVDRDAVADALDVLGNLNIIELQRPADNAPSFPVVLEPDEEIIKRLAELDRLLQAMAAHVPDPDPAVSNRSQNGRSTESVLPQLEESLRAWFDAAHPLAERLRLLATQLEELELLASCLATIPETEIEIGHLARSAHAGAYPAFVAYGDAKDMPTFELAEGQVLMRTYPMDHGQRQGPLVAVGVCAAAQLPKLESQLHSGNWRFVRIPGDIEGSSTKALAQCRDRIDAERRRHDDVVKELDELNQRFQIGALRWVLRRHLWVNQVLADARRGQRFVWLSGWVPVTRLNELTTSLVERRIPFLFHSESPAGHGSPPVQLQNPVWIRRFETFVRGFGVPDANEIDPSPVLAITTPLMFGYMFGDVGHGLVLIVAGLWLQRRSPVLGLLIPAGLSSIFFGILFGSVFCSEHILPALWITPMREPLTILALPVVFGMILILLSLVFDALQESWRGRAQEWWAMRFPNLVIYVGLIGGLLDRRAIFVAGLGLLWTIIVGTIRAARTSGFVAVLYAPFQACAESLETLLQLVINTISFTRLGAFALAHAGLGMAVVILGSMPETSLFKWTVLIAGNVLVIALEGLVVSIQTTRLVMFEFFRRFLIGRGRPFRPLRGPVVT
jgi:V/A-type H+-transporting ATPase subunit I